MSAGILRVRSVSGEICCELRPDTDWIFRNISEAIRDVTAVRCDQRYFIFNGTVMRSASFLKKCTPESTTEILMVVSSEPVKEAVKEAVKAPPVPQTGVLSGTWTEENGRWTFTEQPAVNIGVARSRSRSRSPYNARAVHGCARVVVEEEAAQTGASNCQTVLDTCGDSSEVSRSTEPRQQAPFLCLVFGGPGSGKTSLGHGLQRRFPRLCHVSSGDLARIASTEEAQQRSPLLRSIGRQLGDRRRRKTASSRLASFVIEALADGLRSEAGCSGLIVDGLRVADFKGLEKTTGSKVACVLKIQCSRVAMLARLSQRGSRDGDERLGVADGVGQESAGKDTFKAEERVDAFLARFDDESADLRKAIGAEHWDSTMHLLDGECSLEDCLRSAELVMRESLATAAKAASCHRFSIACQVLSEDASESTSVDWRSVIGKTSAKLDSELHPDGRPRCTAVETDTADCDS